MFEGIPVLLSLHGEVGGSMLDLVCAAVEKSGSGFRGGPHRLSALAKALSQVLLRVEPLPLLSKITSCLKIEREESSLQKE